ncbi:MAG: hypothetical protein ACAH11_14565 [Sphingomonas sp.]
MQDYLLWWIAGALVVLAVLAGFGEHRRRKRRDFDAVGFMPWQMVQILSLILAAGLAAVALHQ